MIIIEFKEYFYILQHLIDPFNRGDRGTNVCHCAEMKWCVCVHWEGGALLRRQLYKPEIKLCSGRVWGLGRGVFN